MAVSGSNDFTVNRLKLINRALRMVGAIDKGQSADKKLESDAAFALNMILKEMDLDFANLHAIQTASFNTVSGQSTYAVADGLPNNVNEIKAATYQFSGTDERKLDIISYEKYESFVDKTTNGDPQFVLLTKEILTADRSIILYPVPQSNKALKLRFWRRLFDMDNLNDDLDMPPESYSYITFRLASDIGEEYNIPDVKAQRLFQKSQLLFDKLKARMTPKVTNYPVEDRKFY